MNIQNIEIEKIKPYEKNTKKHYQTQIDNVAKSIEQYGFVQPLVLDKNNTVVIGHCRLLAAKQLKMKEVPCVMVEDLTPEQVRELRIVDNKTNESEWDLDFLSDELAELDLSNFVFDFGVEPDDYDVVITKRKKIRIDEYLPNIGFLKICHDGFFSEVEENITHWMPLPEPPKDE